MPEILTPPPVINPDLLQVFIGTFFNRLDVYATQRQHGYTYRRKQVTPALVQQHLVGEVTLGTYALSQENTAKWVVLDADTDEVWRQILVMAHALPLPIYLEQSRRGGHVWLFFAQPEQGRDARRFAQALVAAHEIGTIEIYPKQNVLQDGPGSLMRLPFGYHRKIHVPGRAGKRFGFQTVDGQPLASTIREQIATLIAAERVPHAVMQEVIAALPEANENPPHPTPQFVLRPASAEMPLSARIKASIGVAEFVSQYVTLDKNGRGFCPFHDDTHMSLGVNVAHVRNGDISNENNGIKSPLTIA
jgi:hypothetical protein